LKKTTLSHIITESYYYLSKGQSWGSTQLWTNAKFGKGIYLLESKSGIRGGYIAFPRKKKTTRFSQGPTRDCVVEYTSVQ
jgi:hypothetical protein